MTVKVAKIRRVARPVQLVALDLDGTLLDARKEVGRRTWESLREVKERGDCRIVLATARPPRSVRPTYEALGLDTWTINYNGALVWDEQNREAKYHRPLPGNLCCEIVHTVRDQFEEIIVHAEVMDRLYTDREDRRYQTETAKLFAPDGIVPVETFCREPVTKLMLLGEPAILHRIEPMLLERYGDAVEIVMSDRDLIQIAEKGVGKGAALALISGHFGISSSDVLAVGDALNDVGMLRWAGRAVAMGNAHPHVKRVADWVAPTNEEDGVHAALEHFGLVEPA